MTEDDWRRLAKSYPLSVLRTELYEELCTMLELRAEGQLEEVNVWLDEVIEFFTEEFEATVEAEESHPEQIVLLAEMFSSEGVEAWLEAFEQIREGVPDDEVLATAQKGQRYLRLVLEMAPT